MLRDYLSAAMRKAKYEIIPDDGTYYGEIPGFKGVYSNSENLEDCRNELEEVLEEWLLYRIANSLQVPVVNGIDLKFKEVV